MANLIWFLFTWSLLVVVIIAVLGGIYLYNRADEEIRKHVETLLSRQYPHLHVTVRSARLLELEGFEINDVAFTVPGSNQPLALANEIMVRCHPTLDDLFKGQLEVREIIARRVAIRCEREPDGRWSLRHLAKIPRLGGNSLPVIRIENSTIEILEMKDQSRRGYGVRDVNVVVTPATVKTPVGPESALEIEASLTGDHLRRTTINGTVFLSTGRCQFASQGKGVRLDVSPALRDSLPSDLARQMDGLGDLTAILESQFVVAYDVGSPTPLQYSIHGSIHDGRLDDPRLPYPLTDLTATFYRDNMQTTVDQIRARYGKATLECAIRRDAPGDPTVLFGRVANLDIDESLVARFPKHLQTAWQKYRPTGLVNAEFNIRIVDGHWQPSIEFDCKDVSMVWHVFPYPIHHASGTVSIRPTEIAAQLRGKAGTASIRIAGHVRNPGPDWSGWAECLTDDSIPIDESLLGAGSPTMQSVVRAFAPQGHITFGARCQRLDSQTPANQEVDIELIDCSVRHSSIPYPLHDVRGRLELRGRDWNFRELTGRNDSARITCEGSWEDDREGGWLSLKFVGLDVPLESELRDALDPNIRETWKHMRPRGTIDRMDATYDSAPTRDYTQWTLRLEKQDRLDAETANLISLSPKSFPYQIDNVTGVVTVQDGLVQIQRLRGRHGDVTATTGGWAKVGAEGDWTLAFTGLTVDRLRPDREFLNAAPTRLSQALANMNVQGPASLVGDILLSHSESNGGTSTRWNLDVDLEDGGFGNGFEMKHVSGGVQLDGVATETTVECTGELHVDSMVYMGTQLTDVRGPIAYDGAQVLLGDWATPHGEHPAPDVDRSPRTPTLLARHLTANCYDGQLQVDGQLRMDDEGHFNTRLNWIDARVTSVLRDFGRDLGPIQGRIFAQLSLRGSRLGRHTWRGTGSVQLRDANLYELPFVLSLVKALRTGSTDRTAFTEANVDFRLLGDHAYFDRLDLLGDALTLKGVGELSHRENLNVNFYTVVGREDSYISAVRPLLGMASRRFMVVKVRGTLDDPQMTREVLPGLNETLQQWFPEMVTSDRSAGP